MEGREAGALAEERQRRGAIWAHSATNGLVLAREEKLFSQSRKAAKNRQENKDWLRFSLRDFAALPLCEKRMSAQGPRARGSGAGALAGERERGRAMGLSWRGRKNCSRKAAKPQRTAKKTRTGLDFLCVTLRLCGFARKGCPRKVREPGVAGQVLSQGRENGAGRWACLGAGKKTVLAESQSRKEPPRKQGLA